MRLEDIGFYTLSDQRARDVAAAVPGAVCACERAPFPLQRVELIVTDRCNFRCRYCRGVRPELRGDIPVKDAMRTLELWAEGGMRNVRFSGGEPTLYRDLPLLVSTAKGYGCEHIAISTNGSSPGAFYEKLLESGVNDFSVSLDACCSATADIMAGTTGPYPHIVENIKRLSALTYVTVGVVVTEHNLAELKATIEVAQECGVADVRVIPAAQYSRHLKPLAAELDLSRHPILRYRFMADRPVRGLEPDDCPTCHLVSDDMAVAQGWHFPCIIYLRESGEPIGKVGPNMRAERIEWMMRHNSMHDPICRGNCLDVCIEHNNRVQEYKEAH